MPLFEMPEQMDKDEMRAKSLRKRQCLVCPSRNLKMHEDPNPGSLEILVLSVKTPYIITSTMTQYRTFHDFMVECAPLSLGITNAANDTERQCCLGRKADLILKTKPKLVLCIGYESFKDIETLCGYSPTGIIDNVLFPTRLGNHNFWLMSVPQYDPKVAIMEAAPQIEMAMLTTPNALPQDLSEYNHLQGIEFILESGQIDAAFDLLENEPAVAFDIEGTGLRPYPNDYKLLSLALGTKDHVYAFPIWHPQTPKGFDAERVLERLFMLPKKTKVIAHHLGFEQEHMIFLLGEGFAYKGGDFDDTLAQAYLLHTGPKSLDALVRRAFGFHLKQLSDIDVTNLINTNLEKVLLYNALDTKYTHALWEVQDKQITDQGLRSIHAHQIRTILAGALMQTKGLHPNTEFIRAELENYSQVVQSRMVEFEKVPEVIAVIKKHGKCEPASHKDLQRLFYDEIGINPNAVQSFDEAFLATCKHPVAKIIDDLRDAEKVYGTYLVPLDKGADHENAGKHIHDDGLIHTIFNVCRTATGRTSSDKPNMQNYPSRGGKKRLRSVIKVPEGSTMYAIDQGQIEYRVIAALSKDPEMINAILHGLDIHGWWAKRLMEMFPGKFVKDETDAKEFKEFRNKCKNGLVFPFCFGSSAGNVGMNMGIKNPKQAELISQEFWSKHKRVREWQNELAGEINRNGCIYNAFGRRYLAPLRPNQIINYPIQGSASDLVTESMGHLARISVDEDLPAMCPVINIHDDLTFVIPDDQAAELLPRILAIMLETREYEWLPVPLTVEVSSGHTWGDLKELGTFSSEDLYGIPFPFAA